MTYKRVLMVIAAVVLALVAASCGDDGNEDSTAAQVETTTQSAGEAAEGTDREGGNGSTESQRPQKQQGGDDSDKSGSTPADDADANSGARPGNDSGGDRAASTDNRASPSTEFRRQAKAVCRQSRKDLLREVARYLEEQVPQKQKQQGKAMGAVSRNVLIPSMEGQIAEIRSLDPPPSAAPGANAFLASWQRTLRAAAREPEPLVGAHAKEVLAPVGREARRAGLGACAYG